MIVSAVRASRRRGRAVTVRGDLSTRAWSSADYGEALTKLGAVKSMSRKGDCWDNAVAESFFATIKGEMIDHADYLTRGAAITAIADYIDNFYNPYRRHSASASPATQPLPPAPNPSL
jgi:transposase InsO family protein